MASRLRLCACLGLCGLTVLAPLTALSWWQMEADSAAAFVAPPSKLVIGTSDGTQTSAVSGGTQVSLRGQGLSASRLTERNAGPAGNGNRIKPETAALNGFIVLALFFLILMACFLKQTVFSADVEPEKILPAK
eukprot:TRINITY_DN76649_c0_g1_i1.p2 TRINITY_DN76649_c0_g1~~TRINITY_DN76649_c0_g1_i1.p2  ORF type:complete len:134 (+),score=16.87 TRINITY_DN76649_c0_g1_i1:45-446(+)